MSKPVFVLVAGINGAGKSTFAQSPDALAQLPPLRLINPDILTQTLLASGQHTLAAANLLAAQQSDAQVDQLIQGRSESFIVETVLSSAKYFAPVERAIRLGWHFHFIYVALDTVELALQRIRIRVAQGGHDVPDATVRKRWARSLASMQWFWQRAHAADLYFNGTFSAHCAAKTVDGTRITVPTRCPDILRFLVSGLLVEP